MKKNSYVPFAILFTAPAFVLFSVFFVGPTFFTVFFSLTDMGVAGAKRFIWFANYSELFADRNYWIVVVNDLKLVLSSLLFQVPPAVVLAYLVSRTAKGAQVFRALYFMPIVISPIAIGLMFSLVLNGQYGLLNAALGRLGLESLQHNWLSEKNTVLGSVIAVQVWQYIGFHFVIILAGITTIPDSLFESAVMDGASSTVIFFRIVLPLLREFLMIAIVLTVAGCLKSFGHAWAMTSGGPGIRTTYPSILMYKTAFQFFRFGKASAVAIVILIMALTSTVVIRKLFAGTKIDYGS